MFLCVFFCIFLDLLIFVFRVFQFTIVSILFLVHQ